MQINCFPKTSTTVAVVLIDVAPLYQESNALTCTTSSRRKEGRRRKKNVEKEREEEEDIEEKECETTRGLAMNKTCRTKERKEDRKNTTKQKQNTNKGILRI